MNTTIKEALEKVNNKKKKLESFIFDEIIRFNEETGLMIQRISLNIINVGTMENPKEEILASVEIDIKL